MFPIESEIQDYDKSLIDPSFVTDDGDPILNTIIKKYDELFGNNYNIKYEENFKIYFRFLRNVLKGKDSNYDPNETYSTLKEIKDIDINRHYNGIITKYFPLVDDIRYLTDYSNKELTDNRKTSILNINKYVNSLRNKDLLILSEYEKIKDDICKIFEIKLLKIHNLADSNNRLNIVKLFNNICDDEIHFTQLSLTKDSEKYFKVNKDLLKTNLNPNGIISSDLVDKWYKGHRIVEDLSFEYFYSENAFVMRIYMKELNCSLDINKYITLVFNLNGVVECIVDCNIDKSDINLIFNKCNSIIDKINENFEYSEINEEVIKLDTKFMINV